MPFIGYFICIAIGFLFIGIFTLVGCCFCCCRLCGNCGGKRVQHRSPNDSCKRKVFAAIFFVLVVFTSVGMICVFVTNDNSTTNLDKLDDLVADNLDDVKTFLDNTVKEIKQVAQDNFNFLKSVMFRDLDNIGYLLGIPIRTSFKTESKMDDAFDSVETLSQELSTVISAFDNVDTAMSTLVSNIDTLQANLSDVQAAIYSIDSSIDTSNLNMSFDTAKLPNISNEKAKLQEVQSQNFTALIANASQEVEDIPNRVQSEANNSIADIKKQVEDFSSRTEPMVSMVENFTTGIGGSFNVDNIKAQVDKYSSMASKYNKYRWYGGVGLTCIILLVVVLQFLGLTFGVFGGSVDSVPTQRGCLSNSGGNMLIASVAFIFIFSWLFMLLTTLIFALGAPTEKFVCQPLADPQLTAINKLLHAMGVSISEDGNFSLGVSGKQLTINIPDLLQDCKTEKAAYAAFQLENLGMFNITALTDYKSIIDIDGQIDSMTPDFSSIQVVSPDLRRQLHDFGDSLNVNFSKFYDELGKTVTAGNLSTVIQDVKAVEDASSDPKKSNLRDQRLKLESIESGSYADTLTSMGALNTSVASLEQTVSSLPTQINDTLEKLEAVETFLQNNGSDLAKTLVKTYVARLTGSIDSYITNTLNALNNDIAKCTPVWNLYNSVAIVGICKYVIDPLNGFWFSLGWCVFFFVPSVIFAVKLAKHYRRMDSLDPADAAYQSNKGTPGDNSEPPPPYFANNKIGHSDKF